MCKQNARRTEECWRICHSISMKNPHRDRFRKFNILCSLRSIKMCQKYDKLWGGMSKDCLLCKFFCLLSSAYSFPGFPQLWLLVCLAALPSPRHGPSSHRYISLSGGRLWLTGAQPMWRPSTLLTLWAWETSGLSVKNSANIECNSIASSRSFSEHLHHYLDFSLELCLHMLVNWCFMKELS